jgi:hypothetical protein
MSAKPKRKRLSRALRAEIKETAAFLPSMGKPNTDPIFSAIEAHENAYQKWSKLDDELDRKEHVATKKIGQRPSELVMFGNYHTCGDEMKFRRDQLIRWHKINPKFHTATPKIIRAEYQDALKRSRAQCREAAAWDRRAGIATLRKEVDAAFREELKIGRRLGRTKPTTPGGAAAVLQYIEVESRDTDMSGWYREALITTAKALQAIDNSPAGRCLRNVREGLAATRGMSERVWGRRGAHEPAEGR